MNSDRKKPLQLILSVQLILQTRLSPTPTKAQATIAQAQTSQTHTHLNDRGVQTVYTTCFKWDGDRWQEELQTYVYQPQSLKDSLAKRFDALQLYCKGLQQKHRADKTNSTHRVPVTTLTWQRVCIHEQMRRRRGAKVHICACAHLVFFCLFLNLVCVCVSLEFTCCLSRTKDRQGSRTGGGWKGCSHVLSPDKAHLFGLGLPLPLSPHIGDASFSALGLSEERWKKDAGAGLLYVCMKINKSLDY